MEHSALTPRLEESDERFSTRECSRVSSSKMQERASHLFKTLEESEKQLSGEGNRVSRPKIQRIPDYMGGKVEFQRYYWPQTISLGVFHTRTMQGEQYKYAWAAMYLKDTNQKVEDLFMKIFDNNIIYDGVGDWKMFVDPFTEAGKLTVDACSVLELLQKSDLSVDPEKELKISIDNAVLDGRGL